MMAPSRTQRRSIGHGRVLPPGQRQASAARVLARQLVVKAARRLRRAGYLAQRLTLSVDCLDAPRWTAVAAVAAANDDRAGLEALAGLWAVSWTTGPPISTASPERGSRVVVASSRHSPETRGAPQTQATGAYCTFQIRSRSRHRKLPPSVDTRR